MVAKYLGFMRSVRMNERRNQEVRRARCNDGAALASIYLRSTAKLGFLRRVHGPRSMWHHFTTMPSRNEVWVTLENQHITGFMTLRPGWIDHLYIHPRHQNMGAGHTLLSVAKERSGGDLRLWTFQQNKPALAFYSAHGFTLARRTDGRANEEHMPDCLMIWEPDGT
ncbi:MAG: hypothetical protein CML99_14385 [Rhodobiaceae bacterium]|nr:hypothetical protein [Rhodobiaceae bacterium]